MNTAVQTIFNAPDDTAHYFKYEVTAEPIKTGGSSRRYYRLTENVSLKKYIYCEYTDSAELVRFIKITDILKKNKINVQKIIHTNFEKMFILLEDLGAFTVYDFYHKNIVTDRAAVIDLYKKIISMLIDMQINCAADLAKNFPARKFDKSVYLWETDYFKNMVLDKYLNAAYDKVLLAAAFEKMADTLDKTGYRYFLHRDFQSQNIIISNDLCYFIDYQTAFNGSNYYDLASLLCDPYINADTEFKKILIDYYQNKFEIANCGMPVNFEMYFEFSRIQRLMQANAAYVKLGLLENKQFFRNHIENALTAVNELIRNSHYVDDYLKNLFAKLEKDGKIKCAE